MSRHPPLTCPRPAIAAAWTPERRAKQAAVAAERMRGRLTMFCSLCKRRVAKPCGVGACPLAGGRA